MVETTKVPKKTEATNGKGKAADAHTKKADILKLQKELNEKLERLDEFNILNENYKQLKDVQKELAEFVAGADEDTRTLQLNSRYNHGSVFSTHKTDIIDEVLKMVNERVTERVQKVETQLAAFAL